MVFILVILLTPAIFFLNWIALLLLKEMNGHMRDVAFHARRIPVDPND
jgi:hypothetical protein